ncbi:hypothetical protein ABW19_dt0204481 [Dactylella cylindrospora]|nr:hypothetical protein ABW19_dt0204481 [Dactylella cylindrospora]
MAELASSLSGMTQPSKAPTGSPQGAARGSLSPLPVEIVHLISKNLNGDDLLSLRLTCRDLDFLVRDLHRNEFYRCRTYYLNVLSLELLVKLSRSEFGRKLEHLKFDLGSPCPQTTTESIEEHAGQAGLTGSDLHRLFGLVALNTKAWKGPQDVVEKIRMAFSNLPNLKVIEYICSDKAISARTLDIYLPEGCVDRLLIRQLGGRLTSLSPFRRSLADSFAKILSAAVENEIALEEIIIQEGLNATKLSGAETKFIHSSYWSSPKCSTGLSKIKELHLYLDDSDTLRYGRVPVSGLSGFLEPIANSLESLKFLFRDSFNEARHQPLFSITGYRFEFSRLRNLELQNSAAKVIELCALLSTAKSTLRRLVLRKCCLVYPPGDWRRVLRLLASDFQLQEVYIKPRRAKTHNLPLIEYTGAWTPASEFNVFLTHGPSGYLDEPIRCRVVEYLGIVKNTIEFWWLVTTKPYRENGVEEDTG